MKDKINTLLDLLQGTESIEFSIYRGKSDEYNGKPRIELHLTDWYKPIFGDSWDECIDKAIEFIKGENKNELQRKISKSS